MAVAHQYCYLWRMAYCVAAPFEQAGHRVGRARWALRRSAADCSGISRHAARLLRQPAGNLRGAATAVARDAALWLTAPSGERGAAARRAALS